LFREGTNYFDVLVAYRQNDERGFGESMTQLAGEKSYLIIRCGPQTFGNVFISYKHPEDLELAKTLHTLTERAGFVPYIAPEDLRPGTQIWEEKIPNAIRSSKAMFAIWTRCTPFGQGVRKELKICREAGIRVIPLLENGVPRPDEYDASVEFTHFDRNSAPTVFAKVVRTFRETM
jgi:hypothetical protein